MRIFTAKLVIFTVLVVLLQFLIVRVFPYDVPVELQKARDLVKRNVDVVYFGDSVLRTLDGTDTDKRAIPDMLHALVPEYSIGVFDRQSFQAEMFASAATYLSRSSKKPRFIIVPISLRTFSPEWDARPEYQFEYEKLFLQYGDTYLYPFLHFLINIEVFRVNTISQEEFENTPVYHGNTVAGLMKEYSHVIRDVYLAEDQMKRRIEVFYLYNLSSSHRKIKALQALQTLFHNTETTIVYYFMPLDIDTVVEFGGQEAKGQIDANKETIKQALSGNNSSIVLDLSYTLRTKDFVSTEFQYLREHLNQNGRQFIATQLAKAMISKHR